jgi:hypothetical protein
MPEPCRTAEAIIAPNIQLAGNLIQRSSSATATAAAINSARSSGEAIAMVKGAGAAEVRPVTASSIGSPAVRMMTRMVCTTAIAGTFAPRSAASITICDSAPGLPASSAEVLSQP